MAVELANARHTFANFPLGEAAKKPAGKPAAACGFLVVTERRAGLNGRSGDIGLVLIQL